MDGRHVHPWWKRLSRRERFIWAAACVVLAVISGSTAYAAATPKYTDQCVRTVKANGGIILNCDPIPAPPSPTPKPSPSPSPSPSPTPTTPPVTTPPPTTVPPTTPPATTPPPTVTPTVTPSPTPTPTGPQLNCVRLPSACGYPDATNTGFRGQLGAPEGALSLTTDGMLITGRDLGCVSVTAANVIIRDSRIRGGACSWAVTANGANLVLDHVTITCENTSGKGVVMQRPATILGSDISGCEDGVYIDPAGGTVQDSYVHDLFHGTGAHTDDIQPVAGGQAVITHNTLFNSDSQGSSVISADTTDVHDIIVTNNLMAGGGYSMRCPAGGHGTNVQVVNNRFSMQWVQYAVWNDCLDEAVVSGNIHDETGAPL